MICYYNFHPVVYMSASYPFTFIRDIVVIIPTNNPQIIRLSNTYDPVVRASIRRGGSPCLNLFLPVPLISSISIFIISILLFSIAT